MSQSKMRVRVKPGSRKGPLVERGPDGVFTVYVKERAVDGAANAGVVAALAEYWGVPPRDIAIVAGYAARIKTVTVTREQRTASIRDRGTCPE